MLQAFNALVTAGDLIDTDAEEFSYKYGTANVPIRSRSPMYRQYYRPQIGSGCWLYQQLLHEACV